jgi:hypothetical protein
MILPYTYIAYVVSFEQKFFLDHTLFITINCHNESCADGTTTLITEIQHNGKHIKNKKKKRICKHI